MSRHAVPSRHVPKTEADEPNELEKTVWFLNFVPFTEAVSMEDIIKETKHDKTLRKLRKALQKGYINKGDQGLLGYSKVFQEITTSDEGLMMKGDRIILPSSLVSKALKRSTKEHLRHVRWSSPEGTQ